MIRYAKDKGLTDVVVNTNAALMDEEASHKLIASGLDAVYIGLDAHTHETYEKLRVGGQHQDTVANILKLIELKKKHPSSTPDIFVQFVEMEENAHELQDFIDFWKQHEVSIKIRPKVTWAGSIEAKNQTLGQEDRWPCHWGIQSASITDRGDVVTCAVDLDARHVAGNVAQTSLKSIWNGPLQELRKLQLEERWSELPDICANCTDWQAARSEIYQEVNP